MSWSWKKARQLCHEKSAESASPRPKGRGLNEDALFDRRIPVTAKSQKTIQPFIPALKGRAFWLFHCKKSWHYFWHDDSLGSWLLNIAVAFVVIRFIVYPVLGIVLGTSFPIVAVVSESMEHGLHNGILCGKGIPDFKESLDNYWDACGKWYGVRNITKEEFSSFPFDDGFNKGDVIILWRANQNNVKVGDVLIYQANRPQPIIHRVVRVMEENGSKYYQTKGDHNAESIESGLRETKIEESRILGKGVIRVPYLGWLKIIFVELLKPFGIVIER